jgi:hypothetical protein
MDDYWKSNTDFFFSRRPLLPELAKRAIERLAANVGTRFCPEARKARYPFPARAWAIRGTVLQRKHEQARAWRAWPTVSLGQQFPEKPIRFVVGFTPGGPSDILARALGQKLGERWSQQVVIENRPGAGGNVAAEAVAKSAPDGYTWLLGNNSILATNQSLYRSLGYDPVKDFAPVSLVAVQPNILVVNPQVPVHSVAELISLARKALAS